MDRVPFLSFPGAFAGDPDIRVTQQNDWLSINPQFMEAGNVALVVAALRQVLVG